MTIEDRLRQAIEARTNTVEPSPDALDRITDKLLDKETPMDLRSTRAYWLLGAAAAILLLVAAVAGGLALGSDEDGDQVDTVDNPSDPDPRPTPTTTAPPTDPGTTGTTPSSDPAPSPLVQDRRSMIWPRPSSSVTFDSPEAVARSFALYYAQFDAPVVGTFRPLEDGYGEVPVQAFAGGSETTVVVRQLDDAKWYVTGSRSEDIVLMAPLSVWMGGLSCPLDIDGEALTFEGHVDVRIDAYEPDGDRRELGRGFVTGSGSPPAGPFSGVVGCTVPSSGVEDHVVVTLSWASPATDSADGTTGTMAIVAVSVPLPG